jgi:hypothetical protein
MGGQMCGVDPKHQALYEEHKDGLDRTVKISEAARHIEERYPSFKSQAQKKFDEHEGRPLEAVADQKGLAKRKLADLKEQVVLKFGSLKEFERKVGAGFDRYLNSEEDLGQFDEYGRRCKSEFNAKKAFLLKSLAHQKDLYLVELRKTVPPCAPAEALGKAELAKLLDQVREIIKPDLEASNARAYELFTTRMALPLLENNLLELDAEKESESHYRTTIQRWTKLVENIE